MSRVGKKPVPVPSGVTANVSGTTINVKGPKGTLSLVFDERVSVEMDKGEIKVDPKDEFEGGSRAVGHHAREPEQHHDRRHQGLRAQA